MGYLNENASKRASRESGVYGQSDSDYSGSDGNSTQPTDTDRDYYGYVNNHGYSRLLHPGNHGYDDRLIPATGGSDGNWRLESADHSQTDDDDERESLSDLRQLEQLEETLRRHTYNERKTLIAQSRDRMLQDLINLDEMQNARGMSASTFIPIIVSNHPSSLSTGLSSPAIFLEPDQQQNVDPGIT